MKTRNGNVRDLMVTLEVMEAGRIVTAVGIPGVQKNQEDR